jgi:photosynthetic reaction center cytochrome c subunit
VNRISGILVAAFCSLLACRTSQDGGITADADLESERNAEVEQLLQQIAGHENEPAEKVFKNIQLLNGMPAGRLLRVMNVGYSHALNVGCQHCHVEDYWEVDEKRPKRAAREMIVMTRGINEQIEKMQNLEGDDPLVNCSTCHRSEVRPGSTVRR